MFFNRRIARQFRCNKEVFHMKMIIELESKLSKTEIGNYLKAINIDDEFIRSIKFEE